MKKSFLRHKDMADVDFGYIVIGLSTQNKAEFSLPYKRGEIKKFIFSSF